MKETLIDTTLRMQRAASEGRYHLEHAREDLASILEHNAKRGTPPASRTMGAIRRALEALEAERGTP